MSENKIIPTLWATVYSKTTKRSHLELYYITFTSNDQVKTHTNTLMIFTAHMKKKSEKPFGLTWHMDVGSAKLNFVTLQEKM